jgi:predicted ATPase
LCIQQISVEGFRSLKSIEWKPGKLNVVIGPNASGKSNLLRALETISLSAKGKLRDHILSEGGMQSLLWNNTSSEITFRVSVPTEGIWAASTVLDYQFTLTQLGRSADYIVSSETMDDNLGKFSFSSHPTENSNPKNETELSQYKSSFSLLNSLLSSAKDTVGVQQFQEKLAGFRIYQEISVGRNSPIRQANLTRMENQVSTGGDNLVSVLHTRYTSDREFRQTIDSAMRGAFGTDYQEINFPPAADNRVQMRITWKSLKQDQSAADLSDGTLRFLILMTILADPNPPSLIAFDEPETGLHPSMLPIIAEHAVDASLRTQIIFTTHSDQFLDAFAETRPTTTVAKRENGETVLRMLDEEALSLWLNEYSLGALYRSGELESEAVA